jgi:hypothetical protein
MCRSIKTLRPPYLEDATDGDISSAALQYVRKVAGMRSPSRRNEEAFDTAVREVAAATERLLAAISVPIRVPAAGESGPRKSEDALIGS